MAPGIWTVTAKGAFSSRVACSDDETKIWDVLVEVAPDIPARVEDPKDQENLKTLISKWVHNSNSWIALNSNSLVIGFILTEPAMAIRLQEKNKALYMPYIGVSKKWQGRGVFPQLLNELKSQGEPFNSQRVAYKQKKYGSQARKSWILRKIADRNRNKPT